ncbi:hypothetical protein ACLB2K_004776 [Fragaria x ananassa]
MPPRRRPRVASSSNASEGDEVRGLVDLIGSMLRGVLDRVQQPRCLICQQVKAKRQKPSGLLESLPIPVWKWDYITMDFVFSLPRTREGHDGIWVIVDKLTKSAHFLPMGKKFSLDKSAELYANEKIKVVRDRLKAAQSRQKSYADVRRKDLEFQPISLQKDLSYEEEPVQILDRKEQVLRSKSFQLVKVLWRSHQVEEATWEPEEQMRQQYPYLFE